jgi:putative ABC transport system ATP-binding protein
MSVFQTLNTETGITIALVTHEPDIAQYARRVIVFKDGRVKSDEMIKNPRSAREELENMPALEDEEDDDE